MKHRTPQPRPECPQAPEGCRYIALTKGQFALVDAADFDWLNQWNWYAAYRKSTNSYYAMRRVAVGKEITMQAQMLGSNWVDHANHKTLDNRRINIRPSTAQQNHCNKPLRSTNTSGFKGVVHSKNKWAARITVNYRQICLGHFTEPMDAARAYDAAALKYHGQFACINFPQENV